MRIVYLGMGVCVGIVIDRYLTGNPLVDVSFRPKVRLTVQNAYLRDPER